MPETLAYAELMEKQREIRGGFPETMGLRAHRPSVGSVAPMHAAMTTMRA